MFKRRYLLASTLFITCLAGIAGYVFLADNDEAYKTTLPDLQLVSIPIGDMDLEVPIYSYVKTDYVKKHIVIDEEFKIGAYEITIKQWNICYKSGGCAKAARMRKGETENHPVTKVNWLNAYNFTQWLSDETGQNFRLPTEEEWTYAAFMGQGYRAEFVEYDFEDVILAKPKITHAVGTFGQNGWGMHDVQGNVWEWTLGCWTSSVDRQSELGEATLLNNPKACGTRFLWGEERAHIPFFVNTTYNGGCATARPASNLGFRVVLVKT